MDIEKFQNPKIDVAYIVAKEIVLKKNPDTIVNLKCVFLSKNDDGIDKVSFLFENKVKVEVFVANLNDIKVSLWKNVKNLIVVKAIYRRTYQINVVEVEIFDGSMLQDLLVDKKHDFIEVIDLEEIKKLIYSNENYKYVV